MQRSKKRGRGGTDFENEWSRGRGSTGEYGAWESQGVDGQLRRRQCEKTKFAQNKRAEALAMAMGTVAVECGKMCWEEEQRNGPGIVQGGKK